MWTTVGKNPTPRSLQLFWPNFCFTFCGTLLSCFKQRITPASLISALGFVFFKYNLTKYYCTLTSNVQQFRTDSFQIIFFPLGGLKKKIL